MEGGGDAIITATHVTVAKGKLFLKEPPSDVFCEAALWKLCGLLFGRWVRADALGRYCTAVVADTRHHAARLAMLYLSSTDAWTNTDRSVRRAFCQQQGRCCTFGHNQLLEYFLLRH